MVSGAPLIISRATAGSILASSMRMTTPVMGQRGMTRVWEGQSKGQEGKGVEFDGVGETYGP